MGKKFTILTAVYNSEKYLNDWKDSILAQNYRPLEVICVEDKSTDNSLKIINKVEKYFRKNGIDFELIRNPKKLYCGSAYNVALKHATGEYFGVLDSDDMLEPFACEFIVGIYEKNPDIAWIYTQYNKYNRTMNRVIKKGFCNLPGKGQTILSTEKSGINIYGHWRTFSNRINNFKNLFGRGLKCCVDKYLGFRLEEIGTGMFVDKVCYRYRRRNRGEQSVVYAHPLRTVKIQVMKEAKKRRKGSRVYPILRYKR